MAVDAQVQSFLDQFNAANVPPVETQTPEAARETFLSTLATLGAPEPVHATEDRKITGSEGNKIPIRIYVPREADGLPVTVYFHGGGWVVGSIETHDGLCRALARTTDGVVVSVDYRLAPEHKYPAAADDCYAATCWVAEHAAALGADPARLAVAGDSAGGNLAAAVSLMARDRGGPAIACQALIYPVTGRDFERASYLEKADGYMLTRNAMMHFWNQYLPDTSAPVPYAAPLSANDLSRLPAAIVITAEHDPLCGEGEAYATRLRDSGVVVTVRHYPGMIHGFLRRLSTFDTARVALDTLAADLQRVLGSPDG